MKIQSVLSELLRKKLKDPRIELATISGVQVTGDLRVAYVYFSVFGDQKKIDEAMEGFKHSHGFIKREMAPRLGLKYMPEIKFVHDTSFDRGSRIDALLNSVASTDD